jgi:hypothetical protein
MVYEYVHILTSNFRVFLDITKSVCQILCCIVLRVTKPVIQYISIIEESGFAASKCLLPSQFSRARP